MNFNKEKCDEWEKARRATSPMNPFTKRRLKKDGPTFKKIDLICRQPQGSTNVVIDLDKICSKWLKYKHPHAILGGGQVIPAKAVKQGKIIANVPPCSPCPKHKKSPKRKKKSPCPSVQSPVCQRSPSPARSPLSQSMIVDETFLSYRKVSSEEITNYLRKTVNDQTITPGNACMSNTKTLLKYFTNVRAVGKGSFGTVYIANVQIKNEVRSIAIKEGQITKTEADRAKKVEFPLEYLYNQLMNNILNNGFCPSFSYTYCILFCDHCEVLQSFYKPNGQIGNRSKMTTCSVTMVEKADSDLKGLNDQCAQLSALFQILAAVHCIHVLYGMHHRDIKIENILMRKIDRRNNEYWLYKVDGVDYYVPNAGFIAILNDFGVSDSFDPAISNGDYGVRNAEVVATSNGGYVFKPFFTQRYPQMEKNGRVTSIPSPRLRGPGGATLTLNRFWKGFNSHPNINVDLGNFQKFPAFGMYQDIQDVLKMFVGGKQTVQPGSHDVMKGLDPCVKQALTPFNEKLIPTNIWPTNKVELFLANHLIHKIFTAFGYNIVPKNGIVLEVYTLPSS
jgi:serine/threonine protein kinase